MAVGGRLKWDDTEYEKLVHGPDGPTARMLQHVAEVVTQGAKRRAATSPDGSHGRPSGYMRSNIGWRLDRDDRGLYADIVSAARTPEGAPYGLFVEVGSGPHIIESHGDYPLRDKHGRVFGLVVHHPGTDAQPYLRPALDDIPRRIS